MSGSGGEQQVQPDPIEGLPADFTEFFLEVQHSYIAYAYQALRNRQDAEDAVQTAGMKIHAKWDEILSHANPRALAHRILGGVVKDYNRSRIRAARNLQAAARDVALGRDYVEQIRHLGTYDALDRAMEELAEREPVQAECVRLRVAGLTYEEIATTLGITAGTARVYYCRGRQLAKQLADAYLHHETEGEPS